MGVKSFFSRMFAGDGDRSPWGDFWFEPVTMATLSGARVSADTAMRLSAVFRAVGLVSGHMAMLPLKFYQTGTRQPAQHSLIRLLNVRPNQWQNAFEWREMLQGHLELRGNAYNRILSDRKGTITDLVPMHPDKVKIEQFDDGNYRYRIKNSDGSETVLPRGEVWHLRGMSSNGITGLAVIDCARESMGMGLSAQEYASRFFANDQKPTGGWLEYDGKFKDRESRAIFTESLKAAITGSKRHGILTLDQGMKYHEVGVTNKDAQFLELRKFSVTDIARWFGVPPHKLGDLERATFSNIEQQALEYVQDALLPRGKRWEASITAELLYDDEQIDVEYDYTVLLRGDSAARRAYYHGGILDGWLTRNEARGMEGLLPLDGLDEPLRPLNMVEESEAEDLELDQEQIEPPAEEAKETPEPADDESAQVAHDRLQAVAGATAQRLARRFAKGGDEATFITVTSQAFALDPAVVTEAMESLRAAARESETALAAALTQLGSHP